VPGADRAALNPVMSDTGWLKLVEAGGLVAALAVFVWWQMRDLANAKRESAAKREKDATADKTSASTGDGRDTP